MDHDQMKRVEDSVMWTWGTSEFQTQVNKERQQNNSLFQLKTTYKDNWRKQIKTHDTEVRQQAGS